MAERKKRSEFNTEQEDIAKELDSASALSSVAASAGGKLLILALQLDAIGAIDTLSERFKELTLQEFVSICAELKTKLDLMRSLSRAKKNKDYLQEILEEKLKE